MKRVPLVRRTGLPPKRLTPRRNEGRVQHGRMKRARVGATAAEKRHLARVALMPCCLTGQHPVEVHHLLKAPDKRTRRDHRWVVPLTPDAHRGPAGVHGLGTEAKFEAFHGLAPGFLIAWAAREWEASCRVF